MSDDDHDEEIDIDSDVSIILYLCDLISYRINLDIYTKTLIYTVSRDNVDVLLYFHFYDESFLLITKVNYFNSLILL